MTEDSAASEAGRVTRRQVIASGGMLLSASALLAACGGESGAGTKTGSATGIGDGLDLTKLSQLRPFEFSDEVGPKPNLPKRFSFSQIGTAEVFLASAKATKMGCDDRGLEYVEANADGEVATQVQQVQTFLQRETGAVQLLSIAPNTLDAVGRQALATGAAVFHQINGPSTCQQMNDQYKIGKFHGDAAVEWIRKNLGGKASVVYFNPNALAPPLAARTRGALDALGVEPGIRVINIGLGLRDWNPQGGFAQTSSVLQAHPEIDVILSGDAVITGAVKAVQAAGNTTVKYISGVDGEKTVLDQVKDGDSLIKASFAFAFEMCAYATAHFAADWLEGKTIPQAIEYIPAKLDSAAAIDKFRELNDNPADVWRSSPDLIRFHGAISYGTRQKWIRAAMAGDQ